MEISPVVCWLVAGLLLVGVDMLLGTFYLLVMGLAAGCGALAAWGGLSVGWQFSVFAVATIVGSLIVQRFRSAKPTESDALQQPDVGQSLPLHGPLPLQALLQFADLLQRCPSFLVLKMMP